MHHVPRITRLLALWSLPTSGMIKPQSVEPIFYSIYANPAEHTELRIAAFNVLIKLNPPMAVFHKIAQRLVLQYYEKLVVLSKCIKYEICGFYLEVECLNNLKFRFWTI